MLGDYVDIPFLQAEHYRTGRPDGPPIWIVWHTMEEDELPDRAEAVAEFFAYNTGSRTVSAHYTHDNDSSVQCVLTEDVAFTVGNREGNNRGINHELAGRASQRSVDWANDYSQSMLRRATALARRDMEKHKIPNRWCSLTDLAAFRSGHTTHNDLGVVFEGTTHTDPGAGFPKQQIIDLVNKEDDMSAEDAFQGVYDALHAAANKTQGDEWINRTARAMRDNFAKVIRFAMEGRVSAIEQQLAVLLARDPVDVNEEELANALAALLPGINPQIIVDKLNELPEEVTDAIRQQWLRS